MVISLAHYHAPSAIQFTLVDPKRVSFAPLVSPIGSHLANPLCYECEEAVQRLGAKARAAGIHLILATQRPDAKTVQPGIKANIPGKIALKVQSPVNSRIILSEGGAEALLGRGDMLADLGQGVVRAQAPLA